MELMKMLTSPDFLVYSFTSRSLEIDQLGWPMKGSQPLYTGFLSFEMDFRVSGIELAIHS